MNSMKKQKDRTLKDELPMLVGAQYPTEKRGEITPERTKRRTNQKQCLAMDVTSDGSKYDAIKNNDA